METGQAPIQGVKILKKHYYLLKVRHINDYK